MDITRFAFPLCRYLDNIIKPSLTHADGIWLDGNGPDNGAYMLVCGVHETVALALLTTHFFHRDKCYCVNSIQVQRHLLWLRRIELPPEPDRN